AVWAFWRSAPDGYTLNLHPMGFAAWFGLLATALNLFPIGQLDGGHITYAVLGRRSVHVTLAGVAAVVALAIVARAWIVFAWLMIAMLVVFGPRHPRVFDEDQPLDRTRLFLAFCALAMFVLCFTPAPITLNDLIAR